MVVKKGFLIVLCMFFVVACATTTLTTEESTFWFNVGSSYGKSGMYPEAIKAFKKAIRIKPDFAEAHYNLGLVYGNSGVHAEAIEVFKKAIRIKPDYAEAHYNLGLAYGKSGMHTEAIKAFKEVVRIKPDFAEAHLGLGVAYLIIDDRGSALEEYKILKDLNPELANKLSGLIDKKPKSESLEYVARYPGFFSDTEKTYTNQHLGIKITVKSDWNIYTQPLNSDPILKEQFTKFQSESFEVLFLGMTNNKRAFVQCSSEQTDFTVKEYFKLLFEMEREKIEPINAKYYQANQKEIIIWQFKKESKNVNLRFIEYIFGTKGHIHRLRFWTLSALYDDYSAVFEETAKTICTLDPASDSKQCYPVWSAISGDNGELIEYATDKRELYFPEDDTDICVDSKKSYTWKVSSPTNTVYLLGSIHSAKPEMYPLNASIENAFDESDALVLEVNPTTDSFKEKTKDIIPSAQYPKGETLKDHISEGVYLKLEQYLNKVGLPLKNFLHFKPWFITLLLEEIQLQSLGISQEYGMEEYFINKATKKGKNILELETFEEQMSLLQKYLNDELFLSYTLFSIDNTQKNWEKLLKAWKCGNTKVMDELLFGDIVMFNPEVSVVFEKLFYERNQKMAEKILLYLKDKQNYFVVIGAGHLTGEKSIQSFIENAGYKAEQL